MSEGGRDGRNGLWNVRFHPLEETHLSTISQPDSQYLSLWEGRPGRSKASSTNLIQSSVSPILNQSV